MPLLVPHIELTLRGHANITQHIILQNWQPVLGGFRYFSKTRDYDEQKYRCPSEDGAASSTSTPKG